jgi:hypothetical protein
MRRNIFVLGLDDFHERLLETVGQAEQYRFIPLLKPEEIINRTGFKLSELLVPAKRTLDDFPGPVHAIISHWDFPSSTILPILLRHCNLPGPSLESVLSCEHKYWSRLKQSQVVPDNVPRFIGFNPFRRRPRDQIDLDYPFWIKPIKSHSSFLAFKVRNDEEFASAIAELRAKIGLVAEPFNEILELATLPPEVASVEGFHCVAEQQISSAAQCTVEGYVLVNEAHAYGVVDSCREGRHKSSFVRYEYPSSLPLSIQARVSDLACRVAQHMNLQNSCYNVEFFYNEEEDNIYIVEINPRISKSHCPLFLYVDGASHHQVAIKVALGDEPNFPFRQGRFRHAIKFMLRHLGPDATVKRVPCGGELEQLQREFPEFLIKMHVREGQSLSELSLQESYSFELADIFLAGDSIPETIERYARCRTMLGLELDHQCAGIRVGEAR